MAFLFGLFCAFQIAFFSNCFTNVIEADSIAPAVSTWLASLWEIDASNRDKFSKSTNQLEDELMQRPMVLRIRKLCNHLSNSTENENSSKFFAQHTLLIEEFLKELNSTDLFQRALRLVPEPEDFLLRVKELWLTSGADGSAFKRVFCDISPNNNGYGSGVLLTSYESKKDLNWKISRDEKNVLATKEFASSNPNSAPSRKNFLLRASPEFELTAFAICAFYSRHQPCKFQTSSVESGNSGGTAVALEFKVNTVFDEITEKRRIVGIESQLITPSDGVSEFGRRTTRRRRTTTTTTTTPNPISQKLQEVVDKMWAADEDRIDPTNIKLNWGKKLKRGEVKDLSPDPLITWVDESFLQKPIYASLREIYNEGLFHQPVCIVEPRMDEQRHAKLEQFMGHVFNSEVFQIAYEYLNSLNKTGGDFTKFCDSIFNLWFGTYTRCRHKNSEGTNEIGDSQGTQGSSGWEHVFSGELRQVNDKKSGTSTIVDGHHNWMRYYLGEKAGEINYHGYFIHDEPVIGTFQYTWKGALKEIGGFLFTTSPAFDFSLYTVCALTQPGSMGCRFTLDNVPMFVTSFIEQCDLGNCIATTYPVVKF